MRPLPVTPIFDRTDARALGWSDPALSRAIRTGVVLRLRRGQFTRPGAAGERTLILAAAASVTGSAVSHRSALHLRQLPVVGRRPVHPELTVGPTGTGSAHRVLLHRATLPASELSLVDGTLCTSVARTLVDVGRSCSTATAVAAMDAALNRGSVTLDEIDDVVVRCWNWPGIARAQRALRLIDGRAESALESVSRLVVGRLGLPQPELQARVLDRYSCVIARLDFYWDEFGVAGEADGRGKYDDRDVLTAEKDRQEQLEELGLVVARWGWSHAWDRPHLLRRKIETAFARGSARDRSGFPREWSIQRTAPTTPGEKVIDTLPHRSDQGKT